MPKNSVPSFVVITSVSSPFVIRYSSSSQHRAGLYDKEALSMCEELLVSGNLRHSSGVG